MKIERKKHLNIDASWLHVYQITVLGKSFFVMICGVNKMEQKDLEEEAGIDTERTAQDI